MPKTGKHRKIVCSSEDSSDSHDYGCVPNYACEETSSDHCPGFKVGVKGCRQPYSSIDCCDLDQCEAPRYGFSVLCDSQTESKCPEIEHCKVDKRKKCETDGCCESWSECTPDPCDKKCKPKAYAKCDKREWSNLCGPCDDSSEDSCESSIHVYKVPAPACNVGTRNKYLDTCFDSDSEDEYCDDKKKKKCKDCRYSLKNCKCKSDTESCNDCKHPPKNCKCNKDSESCNGCKRLLKHCKCKSDTESESCKDCRYPPKHCKCRTETEDCLKKPMGRTFNVSFASKVGHPWEDRIEGAEGIVVDKVLGKSLHFTRGNVYLFKVSQEEDHLHHTFYLTADPLGGPGEVASKLPGSFEPLSDGTACLMIGASMPKIFYYQCRQHRMMGGLCFVHDS